MPASPPQIEAFHDPATSTISYLVYDHAGGHAAIIDPVLDFDPKSGRTSTTQAMRLLQRIQAQRLSLQWLLETHAHADHLSAAHWLKQRLGGQIAIGAGIRAVQTIFAPIFNFPASFPCTGEQFDHLFSPDEVFAIGELQAQALFVPGHTPADMAYQVGDAVFVGDTLFMPDVGTARCDFPGGDAAMLYQSIQKLLALPDDTRLFMCHDYPPTGREAAWVSTVAAQRRDNIHVHQGRSAADFIALRTARDQTLDMPTLLLPSVQVNIRAGDLPPAEDNGRRYLKIPLDQL
ncbi:MBL fold metallo-hydrolase [Chitinimonas sp.]|uniref:MBL fold metallo-hydrolase n=1 Tax=Chitinimonas sp. TaxID=1934313 RepID=UPI0035ADF385